MGWQHTFYNELRCNPTELTGVLLTEAPRNPKANREKMTTIMFETFEVPNCYISIQAVMSLYAAGRTTGLVVDSGDGVSHTVPVFEGFSIPHAVEKMEIAGRVLTEWLQKLLVNHAAENFTSSAEKEIVKNIKEELCYVAQNFDEESKAAQGSSENDKPYTLPEKRVIASADRKFAVWKGASTFSSLSTFAASWITKNDYDEHGAAIVGRKCPNS